jgi:hypothetical protein
MHKSILNAKRQSLRTEPLPTVYDPERQINIVYVDGRAEPAVDQPGYLPTNSKTMAAPGDDDPDRAGESLY